MDNCIFCQVIAKKIPNYTVFEDSEIIAFLDIYPQAKGHTVVIPKRHAETVFDLSDAEIAVLQQGVVKVMKLLDGVLHPHGFNTGWNHGKEGGQAVPHIHVHIFPRWHGDGGKSVHAVGGNPGDMSVAEVAKLFSSC